MCIICAAIPATAAVGAKLNADQLRKDLAHPLPIPKITGLMMSVAALCDIDNAEERSVRT